MAKSKKSKAPQDVIVSFWQKFLESSPSKVDCIFPPSLYDDLFAKTSETWGTQTSNNATASYAAAVEVCKEKVAKIVRECYRTNEKFSDPDYDLESDFWTWNCLRGLIRNDGDGTGAAGLSGDKLADALDTVLTGELLGTTGTEPVRVNLKGLQNILKRGDEDEEAGESDAPGSVHRVDWIFEDPNFTVDGFSNLDIRQGGLGDCWFLAAVATLCSDETLLKKICVVQVPQCGVYGISTVVDDNLYLSNADYRGNYDARRLNAKKYRKRYQTGSEALAFARCSDDNETWVALLEKGYAKVHGDYNAISGGYPGEGVEDLTGGVTTKVKSNRIIDKERLFKELVNGGKEFLFACSTHWLTQGGPGLASSHAYSVLKAQEEPTEDLKSTVRLVKIRNPWGTRNWEGVGEWEGPWSDGSEEWTPYWMKKFNHKFGDDGIFWISFENFLEEFPILHRTRLFDETWNVVQRWTSSPVAWVTGYQKKKFLIKVKEAGPNVIVLSQLDNRYFKGLTGQYDFEVHFVLREANTPDDEFLIRARGHCGHRSISAEIDLQPGEYEVLPKITAHKDKDRPLVQDVVKQYADVNPQKLRQIGVNHDIAHAKGLDAQDIESLKSLQQTAKQPEKRRRPSEMKIKIEVVQDSNEEESKPREPSVVKFVGLSESSKKVAPDPEQPAKDTETVDPLEKKEKDQTAREGPQDSTPSSPVQAQSSHLLTVPSGEKKEEAPKEKDAKKQGAAAKNDTKDKTGATNSEITINQGIADDDDDDLVIDSTWNAVCVLGLKVYSKHASTTVDIKTPTDAEGASLQVGDKTSAGATSD